ncbi:MAG: hypothetical protein K2K76_04840, partial [Muribaculaceae bacterium]|nr:hypothetical protein [Muribaculaceae bacterium]
SITPLTAWNIRILIQPFSFMKTTKGYELPYTTSSSLSTAPYLQKDLTVSISNLSRFSKNTKI